MLPASRLSKLLIAFAALVLLLVVPTNARADEVPSLVTHEHAPERMGGVRGFYETGVAVRSLDLTGLTLRTAGVSRTDRDQGSMVLRGSEVSPAVLSMLSIGGGIAVGPFLVGVEIGGGVGGGARAKARSAGDIDVRPSGFAGAMNTSTFLGYMLETKHARYRLDGVLGWELAGLGMERPGFPDTVVSAVNADRWTLGPRVRADFFVAGGVSLGVALGWDARHPMNTTLGFVMSLL